MADEGTINSFEDAANAALAEHQESGNEAAEPETQEAAPEQKAPEPEPEPEHTRWVKSVSGNVDDKGQIIADRIYKQAYELNKQNQATAREIAQYRRMMQHPEVAAAMQRVQTGAPPPQPAKQEPEEEKTDEQILEEFVRAKAKDLFEREYGPKLRDAEIAWTRQFNADLAATQSKLHEEFGKEEYEAVKEEVGAHIAEQAQLLGVHPIILLQELSRRDKLYPTLASAARNILYPRLRETISKAKAETEAAKVNTAKGAKLPGKGTPAAAVKQSRKIDSFQDAYKAAMDENPAFKELE